jgi:hypothetical protein
MVFSASFHDVCDLTVKSGIFPLDLAASFHLHLELFKLLDRRWNLSVVKRVVP